jgi:hypothetical protein
MEHPLTSTSPYAYLRRYCAAACDPAADCDTTVHDLAVQLAAIDPQAAPPDEDLLAAARTHLDLRHAHETHPDPLAWADYGYRTAQALHGPHHQVTTAMAIRLADVHLQIGDLSVSLNLRRQVIQHATSGTTNWAVQKMLLAATRHILGVCGEALAEADAVLAGWQPADDRDRHATGSALLVQHLQLVDDCGDVTRARRLLTAHRALLPPPGHPNREEHVVAVLDQFGVPARIAAHRRVCSSPHRHDRHRGMPGGQITVIRDLVLDALGYTPGVRFPGLQRLFEERVTGHAGDVPPPPERKS